MPSPDLPGPTGKSRNRWWFLIIYAIATVLVVSVILAAILLLPGPPSSATHSASAINVQPSDLGAGWSLAPEGDFSGPAGLVEYSGRLYGRGSAYGGTVYVSSTVEVYNGPDNATRRFAGLLNASTGGAETPIDAGDQGFQFQTNRSVSVLFLRGSTVVGISVDWSGSWEDLTGRPFSAEYRVAGDLLVLAHIVDSRIP